MTEAEAIPIICALLMGEPEVRLDYADGWIRADCVTEDHVVEVGLDKRSSLDSLQQAIFAATLVDRDPLIVIIDTDGELGRFEHRISVAADQVGVTFLRASLP